MFEVFCSFLSVVGFYALCCYLYENLRSPAQIFKTSLQKLLKKPGITSLKQRYGQWAAITGATDGIGKAYARELARQGINVVLISRTELKLQEVAKNIENEFGVRTKWIVADFTQGRTIYEHIENELEELPIGILVNNVGQNTSRVDIMSSCEESELWNVLHTNIAPVTLLSHHFLRRMHKDQIKGIIVNISSGLEMMPLPYGALYSASKAYTRSLTLALQEEARPLGIEVQLVSPNFVVTKINSYSRYIMRGGVFIPQPDVFARWAVGTMGRLDRTTGYFWHGVQTAFAKLMPWSARMAIGFAIIEYIKRTRNAKTGKKKYKINLE